MPGEKEVVGETIAPSPDAEKWEHVGDDGRAAIYRPVAQDELAGETVDARVECVRARGADYAEAKMKYVRALHAVKMAQQARDMAEEEFFLLDRLLDEEIAPSVKAEGRRKALEAK